MGYTFSVPNTELRVAVERRPEACVIHVSGSVDHLQYYKLEEAIQTQLDRKLTRLVVDLAGLTYISSAGINTLGHAHSQFEKVSGRLCYVRPSRGELWKFLETIGVAQILPWAAGLEEALRQVADPEPAR